MNKSLKDSLVVGFALFAVFFGAGNLIFPPSIGLQSGPTWVIAAVGLILTGIVLPILSVIAVSNSEGSFHALSHPVGEWFYKGFNLFVMICVGTAITIPRTSATTHELGVLAIAPNLPKGSIWVTVIIFFALTYYFANDKSNVIDKVGKILTPALLIILLVIVFFGFISPVGTPVDTGLKNPFSNALIQAYQTGDLLTGLLCASVFISAVVSKGYTDDASRKKITLNASIIAGVGLAIVYGGLLYIGATGNSYFPKDVGMAALLTGLVERLLGGPGLIALGIAVALACLTTSVGLTAACADFISNFTKNKISYKMMVAIVCVVGVIQGAGGVDKIVKYAFPMFLFVYPVSIVLTFCGLFRKYIPNAGVYKGAAIAALIMSAFDSWGVLAGWEILGMPGAIKSFVSAMPFNALGFGWVVPTIVGGILGAILYKTLNNQQTLVK